MDNVLVSISVLCKDEPTGKILYPVEHEWHEVSYDNLVSVIEHMAGMHPSARTSIVSIADERVAITYEHNLSHMLGVDMDPRRDCGWLYTIQQAPGSNGVVERLADLMRTPDYNHLASKPLVRQCAHTRLRGR